MLYNYFFTTKDAQRISLSTWCDFVVKNKLDSQYLVKNETVGKSSDFFLFLTLNEPQLKS